MRSVAVAVLACGYNYRFLLAVCIVSMIHVVPMFSQRLDDVLDDEPVRYIRNIYLDKREVFDSTQNDWFFGAQLLNSLHTTTRDYVIEDEMLFDEGDVLSVALLQETERNLRRTRLFTTVRVTYRDVGEDSADVLIRTQEKWTTSLAALIGTGGGIENYGGMFEEQNLFGTATNISAQALYRTENNIGWQGIAAVQQRRLFRSEYTLTANILANQFRTIQNISLEKPFRTLATRDAYGVEILNSFGSDFLYNNNPTTEFLPFRTRKLSAYYARASELSSKGDQYYASVGLSVDDIQRLSPQFRQALDNSGRLLFSLGSIRHNFITAQGVNGYEVEDIPIGAWGMAVLGRTFALGSNKGEGLYYAGGMVEQSGIFNNNTTYLFGQLTAGSGFASSQGRYTYFEFYGIAHQRVSSWLVFAARLRQQTAWNWSAFRQLVLDNDAGLRGYTANELTGENRIVANAEVRVFPNWNIWFFKPSFVAFYDAGTVWNQAQPLTDSRVRHSIGLGIRIHNLKANGSSAIFRFDFAYNVDERRFTGIIFSTDQLFSAFGRHTYRQPTVFGTTIDVE